MVFAVCIRLRIEKYSILLIKIERFFCTYTETWVDQRQYDHWEDVVVCMEGAVGGKFRS